MHGRIEPRILPTRVIAFVLDPKRDSALLSPHTLASLPRVLMQAGSDMHGPDAAVDPLRRVLCEVVKVGQARRCDRAQSKELLGSHRQENGRAVTVRKVGCMIDSAYALHEHPRVLAISQSCNHFWPLSLDPSHSCAI